MPSSTDPAFNLTTTNASSTPYTLKVMTWVAVVLTPLVLLYQGWTYWVFRQRLTTAHVPPARRAGAARRSALSRVRALDPRLLRQVAPARRYVALTGRSAC